MTRARTSRNRATRSTLTCSTSRTAQAQTLGNRVPRRSTAMAPAAMGVTPAICTGTKWAHPTHIHCDQDRDRALLSHIRTRTWRLKPPPRLRRDGRALARPMRLRGDCAWRLLPRQARAARPDCGRHPLTGSPQGYCSTRPVKSGAGTALPPLRAVRRAHSWRTHGVLAAT
jgi:hypothetical protein